MVTAKIPADPATSFRPHSARERSAILKSVAGHYPQDLLYNQKQLPAPNSDFYELAETLPADELAVVKQVRTFMETKVAPIITKYWVEDAFLFELLPDIKELNSGGVSHCRAGQRLACACKGNWPCRSAL
jgi:hypothetical protein